MTLYNKHISILITILIFISLKINAQGVKVIDNKGTLTQINKVTTSNTAPTNPVTGDVWYDDTTPAKTIGKIYDGTSWKFLSRIGTPGSVFFAGTDGAPTENNTQLSWDNPNKKLYVGIPFNTGNANKLTVNGTARAKRFRSSNGTKDDPAFKFSDDNDTGMFSPISIPASAGDLLAFTTGGTEALRIDETQQVNVHKDLSVVGAYKDSSGDTGTDGQILSSTTTGLQKQTNWIDPGNGWFRATTTDAPTNINDNIYTNGRIGINDNNPDYSIKVINNEGGVEKFLRFQTSDSNDFIELSNTTSAVNTLSGGFIGGTLQTNRAALNFFGDTQIADDASTSEPIMKFFARRGSNNANVSPNPFGGGAGRVNNRPLFDFINGNTDSKLRILANGNVGIDIDNPTEKLHVAGRARATAHVTASDIRLKKDITNYNHGINIIQKLTPKKYTLKENNTKDIGLIAQEVQKILPEVVIGKETKNSYLGIAYDKLTVVLINAIQQQQKQIDTLKKEINQLKKEK